MIEAPATWCMYYRGITPPPNELLDINILSDEYKKRPYFAYPMSNGSLRQFASVYEWYGYVKSLRIQPGRVLLAYMDAFDEALRILFMAYALPEFAKSGEMKAFATLEGALLVAYEHKMCETRKGQHRCAGLGKTLEWAERYDALRPGRVDLSKASHHALNVIRDKQMHGRLLEETLPWGGLFEMVKETIEYAYRNHRQYDIHRERLAYGSSLMQMTGADLDYVPPYMPTG